MLIIIIIIGLQNKIIEVFVTHTLFLCFSLYLKTTEIYNYRRCVSLVSYKTVIDIKVSVLFPSSNNQNNTTFRKVNLYISLKDKLRNLVFRIATHHRSQVLVRTGWSRTQINISPGCFRRNMPHFQKTSLSLMYLYQKTHGSVENNARKCIAGILSLLR